MCSHSSAVRVFVTYQGLPGLRSKETKALVTEALGHFRSNTTVEYVDWKTCSHDHALGLTDALLESGFTVNSQESVMVGESTALATSVEPPPGVTLRRVTERVEVTAMEAMQAEVFGDPDWRRRVEIMMRRPAAADGMEPWVAEAGAEFVAAGRMEPVAGTDSAELCGGATKPQWRSRGIYRALTAARARAALAQGKSLLHSSSTEFSRPILERCELVRIASNTTYRWISPQQPLGESVPTLPSA